MADMPQMYYFGCWKDVGHYLHIMTGSRIGMYAVPEDFPCPFAALDCGVLPPRLPQVEGRATLVHLNGWTLLSFWDYSIDTRAGSCSTFVLRGLHTFVETCALAQEGFPRVWRRFTFPIVMQEEPTLAEEVPLPEPLAAEVIRALDGVALTSLAWELGLAGENIVWPDGFPYPFHLEYETVWWPLSHLGQAYQAFCRLRDKSMTTSALWYGDHRSYGEAWVAIGGLRAVSVKWPTEVLTEAHALLLVSVLAVMEQHRQTEGVTDA